MATAIALPRQPHSWLDRLRTIQLGIGARGAVGVGLAQQRGGAAAPWWLAGGAPAPVVVYQPKGAASLAASYSNLANPGTYDAAPGTAPSFNTATGWTFTAASSQYLTTGVIPSSTSWSVLVRFSGAQAAQNNVFGCYRDSGGNAAFLVQPSNGSNRNVWNGSTSSSSTGGTKITGGVYGFAGKTAYLNGSTDGTIGVGTATSMQAVFIGAINYNGSPVQYTDATVAALAIYSDTLTAGEVAAVSASMAAL